MSLYEIIERYTNLVSLIDRKDIAKDLLEESLEAIEEEIVAKVINILEYRKELIQEQKERKRIELEEYLQYCLYLARVDRLETDKALIEVSKENIRIEEREL